MLFSASTYLSQSVEACSNAPHRRLIFVSVVLGPSEHWAGHGVGGGWQSLNSVSNRFRSSSPGP